MEQEIEEIQTKATVQDQAETQDNADVENQAELQEIVQEDNAETQAIVEVLEQAESQAAVNLQEQPEIHEQAESKVEIETLENSEIQDKILLAALKLFAEKGFFNTSLTEIAETAEVKNTGVLYQHFKNKQAIATQLYANILDSLNISIDDIRRKNQKSSEQLRGIVDLLFKLTDDAPDVMRFLLVLKLDEFLPEEKPMLESPAFVKIQKIIQSGIKAGEIRNIDSWLAHAYFFGIINNTLRMVLTGTLDKNADAYQSQVWLAAWNVIAKKGYS
jgi:AcrR family transcriptional regulator